MPAFTVARATAVFRFPEDSTDFFLRAITGHLRPSVSGRSQICADITQADVAVRQITAEFAVIAVLVALGQVAREVAGAADLNTEVAKGSTAAALLLVGQHATNGSLKDHVGHTREERTLSGVVQLVLLVVGVEHGSWTTRDDGFLSVNDDDLVITVFPAAFSRISAEAEAKRPMMRPSASNT